MFITDSQTTNDLTIFGRTGESIYELYNRTITRGGGQVLEEWLGYPLSAAESINKRTDIISHFFNHGITFSFERELLDAAEQYLAERDERTRLTIQQQSLGKKLADMLASDARYKIIVKGIASLVTLLQQLQKFVNSDGVKKNEAYEQECQKIAELLSENTFSPLLAEKNADRLPQQTLANFDSILRFRHYADIKKLLKHIYTIDAYLSLGKVASKNGYCFAQALSKNNETTVILKDVRHPAVANAKGNDIVIDAKANVVFLTGANMAGKSTFMKSVGIAVYLAHCGFPIAASSVEFTPFDGMFSTINLPDNLGMGASHFYAEVLRVKKVAQELHAGHKLFVLFDELFRGTNVKDAAEATIAIMEGFAKKQDSLFIVSTHIIEAGKILKTKTEQIQYRYLPTKMDGHKPVYTYKLEEGITEDRHGMIIIRNEAILKMLEKS